MITSMSMDGLVQRLQIVNHSLATLKTSVGLFQGSGDGSLFHIHPTFQLKVSRISLNFRILGK